MDRDVRLNVYDRTGALSGVVAYITEASGTMVENGRSVATVTAPADAEGVAELCDPGATVDLMIGGVRRESFFVTRSSTYARGGELLVEAGLLGYWSILDGLNAQPEPGRVLPVSTVAAPGSVSKFTAAYDVRNAPTETVIKGVVAAAATRVGLPLTVPASLGRGPVIPVEFRNYNLADELGPRADTAGLSIRVAPGAGRVGYVLDVASRPVLTFTLTEASGIVADWAQELTAPDVTRVLVGGAGEGVDREFVYMVDAAAESLWGVRREAFRDARDVDAGQVAKLVDRGRETLAEGAAKASVTVDLLEAEGFEWGAGYDLGHVVECGFGGYPITDWIRHIDWSLTDREGLTVTPKVGEQQGDPVAAALSSIRRRDRRWKAGT